MESFRAAYKFGAKFNQRLDANPIAWVFGSLAQHRRFGKERDPVRLPDVSIVH